MLSAAPGPQAADPVQETVLDFNNAMQYTPNAGWPPVQTATLPTEMTDSRQGKELGFMQFESSSQDFQLSGSIGMHGTSSETQGFLNSSTYRHKSSGMANRFLENRGFGWLLDVEEDEDFQKPLLEELDIDLRDIYYKVRCVLLPLPYFRLKIQLVRDSPDFWGPLFVVLVYALLSLYGQMHVVSWIMTIWFCGSFVIFFLARVLGGEVSFSQCLGIIGYCLIPLVVTAAVMPVVQRFHYIALFFKTLGVIWAVYSAGTLLCLEELRQKRSLLLYPIFLLYIYFFSLYSGV